VNRAPGIFDVAAPEEGEEELNEELPACDMASMCIKVDAHLNNLGESPVNIGGEVFTLVDEVGGYNYEASIP
jgi:hypothetical protein